MQGLVRAGIERSTFRANPRYELTLLDHVGEPHADVCGWLRSDTLPSGKPVDRLIARVFNDLAEPGLLPAYLDRSPQHRSLVAGLVLDEVLEIASRDSFVCGPEACPLICTKMPDPSSGSALARLSLEAVHHGERLAIDDAARLAARLYFYNRVPITPHWARTFAGADAMISYLHVRTDSAIAILLGREWVMTPGGPTGGGWLTWRSRRQGSDAQQRGRSFKLYISPACGRLRDAFRAAVEVFTDCGALGFKVGNDVYGLLRPDKFVAYFEDFDRLIEAAARILRALNDCPAHGVPFTGDLGGSGLLSWGTDPAAGEPGLPWEDRGSWRLWVTGHLAAALVAAKRHDGIQPWRFALARLAVAGIDPDSWTPVTTTGTSLPRSDRT